MSYHSNITCTSAITTLSSTDLEENFVTSPSNVTIPVNSDGSTNKTRIYCTAPKGWPAATLSWRRRLYNGTIVPVVQDERIKIRKEWLTFNTPQATDAGFYQCVADNGYYERESHFVQLKFPLGK